MSFAVARAFSGAAKRYQENAALQVQVGQWLLQALSPAERWLDVGCGTGYMAAQLKQQGFAQHVVGVDAAQGMLAIENHPCDQCICADMEQLPNADNSVESIVANLSLQWAENPERVLMQCYRVLEAKGLLAFTVPVPGALIELEQSWKATGDTHSHINTFVDAESWKNMLQSIGFEFIAIDQQRFVRWFESPKAAICSLRSVGANRVTQGAKRGLTGKTQFAAMLKEYEIFRQAQGIPMSYEVVRVVAKKPT